VRTTRALLEEHTPDPAAATIPPTSVRVARRLPVPDVATPPPPPELAALEAEPELEPDPDTEVEYQLPDSAVRLETDPDPMLKLALQPLLHLSYEDRQDLRMRRGLQLLEQIEQHLKRVVGAGVAVQRMLEGWQAAISEGVGGLVYFGHQSCAGLARVVVTHPKFPAMVGTLLGTGSAATFFWGYIAPMLWP
jgi:hypothetical protein